MANKELDLFKEILPAIDMGIKELYDAASDIGRKDIHKDLWNLNRWISSIKGKPETQALMIVRVNECYNKNYNVLQKEHKKLLWQLICVAGNRGETVSHPWIKLERKANSDNKAVKLIAKIYPNMKFDEVELFVRIHTKKELKQLAKEHGIDDPDI